MDLFPLLYKTNIFGIGNYPPVGYFRQCMQGVRSKEQVQSIILVFREEYDMDASYTEMCENAILIKICIILTSIGYHSTYTVS